MIAEKFPELDALDPQDQMILAGELWKRATMAPDNTPELTAEAIRILEAQADEVINDPSKGVSWESLRDKALTDR